MIEDNRAKQFLPFDALKGLKSAIKEKEIVTTDKRELSEEVEEIISRKINALEIGDKVKIVHYKNKQYKIDYGEVKQINRFQRFILLGDTKIAIDNIFNIFDNA